MKQWIKTVGTGKMGSRHLSYDEAVAAAHAIARGESTDAQTAAFLMAMRMKGEADEEMMGFIDVFRKYSLPYRSFSHSLNCAGPYDGRLYFPVTIPVSLLLASVGFPQVLHGSESLPPKLGQSLKELLEGLGIQVVLEAKEWENIFLSLNIGFIWTDLICPPFGRVRYVREQMGLRTFFNTVEKVINPVHSLNIIIGVNHKSALDHLIHLLPKSGFETAYIVQGMEGSEDLPTYKNSSIRKVTLWGDESSTIDPATFGFHGMPLEKCSKEQQLQLLNRIIQGDDSPEIANERDHVIFNAGLRLYWFDKVSSYEEGFQLARSLLQRKEAQKLLDKWGELSNQGDLGGRLQANG
ncbi:MULTISPECIES: anthranilate phosphoribosyltransferase [unclassified Paenibacillus]|uniref:anthranilate phosphoribosyltransferase n=1 Tax=unclassified Paenibacillus TaxID=185978 RepID=UPI001AE0EF2C|nr:MULTISPECIES: anthranilate phosphoribosyltransferase [unclassified Paenibacillus]MBP1156573.1 anthranilate phosphoribosyltransferase [Paenibacillus sp. PvP091]MBP1172689.1 anthranilate phosphoribosyltransferase [Paenibacillus sp. PvR098]MBP2439069.1 anthranilate phosphoribosyltransferase [Paenibacillus sp. PvP052]